MALVNPHGKEKKLKPLLLSAAQIAEEKKRAKELTAVTLTSREVGDLIMMGIGGFTGSDPSPTLTQFQAYVAAGEISYFITGGGGFGGGGFGGGGPGESTGSGSEIQAWVEANFTAKTVGGTTVYDLTSSTGS